MASKKIKNPTAIPQTVTSKSPATKKILLNTIIKTPLKVSIAKTPEELVILKQEWQGLKEEDLEAAGEQFLSGLVHFYLSRTERSVQMECLKETYQALTPILKERQWLNRAIFSGYTLLSLAADAKWIRQPSVVKDMIDAGADVHQPMLLNKARPVSVMEYVTQGNLPIKGVILDEQKEYLRRLEILTGYVETLRILDAAGGDLNTKTEDGEPLFFNVILNEIPESHSDILRDILKCKMDLELQDSKGHTLLGRLINWNSPHKVKVLLDAGVRIDEVATSLDSGAILSAMELAKEHSYENIIALLEKRELQDVAELQGLELIETHQDPKASSRARKNKGML